MLAAVAAAAAAATAAVARYGCNKIYNRMTTAHKLSPLLPTSVREPLNYHLVGNVALVSRI